MGILFSKIDLIEELYSNPNNSFGIGLVDSFGSTYLPLFLAGIDHKYDFEFKALIKKGIARNDEFCKALSYVNNWYSGSENLRMSGLISLYYIVSISNNLMISCHDSIQLNSTYYNKDDIFQNSLSEFSKDRKFDPLYKLMAANILNKDNISYSKLMSFRQSHDLWNQLDSGRKILTGQEELSQYLWSYGKMIAQQWMQGKSLIQYPKESCIIIDYGCGQGLGTSLYLDNIPSQVRSFIQQIYLIEPSKEALFRAQNLAECYCPDADVIALWTKLDDFYGYEQFRCMNQIHLFSNVLDVEGFDVEKLAEGILKTPGFKTIYIASTNRNVNGGISRINTFLKYFNQPNKINSLVTKNINVSTHLNSKQFFKRITFKV